MEEEGFFLDEKLEIAYINLLEITTWMYFDYMIRCSDGTHQGFRKMYLEYCEKVIRLLDSRYADHLEGRKKEFAKIMSKKMSDKLDKSS